MCLIRPDGQKATEPSEFSVVYPRGEISAARQVAGAAHGHWLQRGAAARMGALGPKLVGHLQGVLLVDIFGVGADNTQHTDCQYAKLSDIKHLYSLFDNFRFQDNKGTKISSFGMLKLGKNANRKANAQPPLIRTLIIDLAIRAAARRQGTRAGSERIPPDLALCTHPHL